MAEMYPPTVTLKSKDNTVASKGWHDKRILFLSIALILFLVFTYFAIIQTIKTRCIFPTEYHGA